MADIPTRAFAQCVPEIIKCQVYLMQQAADGLDPYVVTLGKIAHSARGFQGDQNAFPFIFS